MMRGKDYSLARMSGMLDLSRDEKATCPPKPRAAAEALLAEVVEGGARTLGRPTGLPSANLPSETQAFLRRIYVYEG